jgi:hypothetical protein
MRIFKTVVQTALAGALVMAASMASANEIRPGCYERIYSSGHLATHPDQHVAAIRMKVGEWATNVSRATQLEAVVANQGRARGSRYAGRTLSQFLFCGTEGRWDTCVAGCDVGSLQVIKQTNTSMTFRTRYLLVGEVADCGGEIDLAEIPGQWVSYKLNRAPDSACKGM